MKSNFRFSTLFIATLTIVLISSWSVPAESPIRRVATSPPKSDKEKNVECNCWEHNEGKVIPTSKKEEGCVIEKRTGVKWNYLYKPDGEFYIVSDFMEDPQAYTVVAPNATLSRTLHARLVECIKRSQAAERQSYIHWDLPENMVKQLVKKQNEHLARITHNEHACN